MTERSEPERGGGGRLVTIAEEGEQIWEELSRIVAAARRTGREGQEALRESLERYPYLTLAAGSDRRLLARRRLAQLGHAFGHSTSPDRVTWMALVQHLLDTGKAPPEPATEGESAGSQPS